MSTTQDTKSRQLPFIYEASGVFGTCIAFTLSILFAPVGLGLSLLLIAASVPAYIRTHRMWWIGMIIFNSLIAILALWFTFLVPAGTTTFEDTFRVE